MPKHDARRERGERGEAATKHDPQQVSEQRV